MSSFTTYTFTLKDGRLLQYAVFGLQLHSPVDPVHTVIYHHGWPSNHMEALPFHDAAARLQLRLIAIDRPGVGASTPAPGGLTFRGVASDTAQLMDHLELHTAIIMGMSGGGPHAMACAALMPQRTHALVLLASNLPFTGSGSREVTQDVPWTSLAGYRILAACPLLAAAGLLVARPLLLAMPALAALPGWSVALPLLLRAAGFGGADARAAAHRPALVAAMLPRMLQQSVRRGVLPLLSDMRLTAMPWREFEPASIQVPLVLLWQGEADTSVPLRMGQKLAATIPGCRPRFLPGQGHLSLMLLCADDIIEAVAKAAGPSRVCAGLSP